MEHGGTSGTNQRVLPIEAVEESDAAYLACIDDCRRLAGFSASICAFLRWMVEGGRREAGSKVRPVLTQRKLARALGLGLATVSRAMNALKDSRLISRADGKLRLHLVRLVEVAEEARSRAGPDHGGFDPAAALERLGVPRCSTCSAGARSVKEAYKPPVSVDSVSVSEIRTGSAPAVEQAEHPAVLKNHRAWRALQTRHFRPVLDVEALTGAFYAAVSAGLLDRSHEHHVRFLATAFDLAGNKSVDSPAVCLRYRVEQRSCWRISVKGSAWAKELLRPADLRRVRVHETESHL